MDTDTKVFSGNKEEPESRFGNIPYIVAILFAFVVISYFAREQILKLYEVYVADVLPSWAKQFITDNLLQIQPPTGEFISNYIPSFREFADNELAKLQSLSIKEVLSV